MVPPMQQMFCNFTVLKIVVYHKKNFFFNYVHFCLFGFTALDRNIDTFLALRVSTPSVVDSSITRVVGLEAGRGKGGVGCS